MRKNRHRNGAYPIADAACPLVDVSTIAVEAGVGVAADATAPLAPAEVREAAMASGVLDR